MERRQLTREFKIEAVRLVVETNSAANVGPTCSRTHYMFAGSAVIFNLRQSEMASR